MGGPAGLGSLLSHEEDREMWKWARILRERLRGHRKSPVKETSLEVLRDGRAVACEVVASRGMQLLCSISDGQGRLTYFLVSQGDCCEPAMFWRVWANLSDDLVWESGAPLNPKT